MSLVVQQGVITILRMKIKPIGEVIGSIVIQNIAALDKWKVNLNVKSENLNSNVKVIELKKRIDNIVPSQSFIPAHNTLF